MSYYMDPVSSYPALHPCDRLGAMRHGGGVALGPPPLLPGVVHPQQQYYPSQPLYFQDIPLQEVPNGHDLCPTAGQLEEEGNWVGSEKRVGGIQFQERRRIQRGISHRTETGVGGRRGGEEARRRGEEDLGPTGTSGALSESVVGTERRREGKTRRGRSGRHRDSQGANPLISAGVHSACGNFRQHPPQIELRLSYET
ncbi:hypothetical protein EYF80_014716 [Liparis tanakae]|uniref:Uncharacterized protein n=1 Tax=Liparis tanakae TaxID=230148 RepID=A0A4Z2IB91_9TELE|nr:hypothetical protein EYF80_014716 [Liparis tanakae]